MPQAHDSIKHVLMQTTVSVSRSEPRSYYKRVLYRIPNCPNPYCEPQNSMLRAIWVVNTLLSSSITKKRIDKTCSQQVLPTPIFITPTTPQPHPIFFKRYYRPLQRKELVRSAACLACQVSTQEIFPTLFFATSIFLPTRSTSSSTLFSISFCSSSSPWIASPISFCLRTILANSSTSRS